MRGRMYYEDQEARFIYIINTLVIFVSCCRYTRSCVHLSLVSLQLQKKYLLPFLDYQMYGINLDVTLLL